MSDTVHVIPQDDILAHLTDEGDECECGTTTEPVKREDGSMGWVIIHQRYDIEALRAKKAQRG